MKELKPHPIADMFPLMNEVEFNELREDIKTHGLLTPIVTYEGKILDGRHRFKACVELGLSYSCEEYNGESPVQYAFSKNAIRRHLGVGQRAASAALLNKHLLDIGAPRERQCVNGVRDDSKRPLNQCAKTMNVGTAAASKAYVILNNNKPLFNQLFKGELRLERAYQIIRQDGKLARGKNVKTELNLKSFKEKIVIPDCFCSTEIIHNFIKTMNAHGWMLEMQFSEGKILANWFGNGYPTVRTNWGQLQPEYEFRRAVIVAAKEKLDKVNRTKLAA